MITVLNGKSAMTAAPNLAVAYLRTSSAANVGDGKDSAARQRAAIRAHAAAHGLELVGAFHDAAVSGADPIGDRPGFAALLAAATAAGAGTILVESASRFARPDRPGDRLRAAEGHGLKQKRPSHRPGRVFDHALERSRQAAFLASRRATDAACVTTAWLTSR
jgi:Resolvase, N terminal domain